MLRTASTDHLGLVFRTLGCTPRWRERLPELTFPALAVRGSPGPAYTRTPVRDGARAAAWWITSAIRYCPPSAPSREAIAPRYLSEKSGSLSVTCWRPAAANGLKPAIPVFAIDNPTPRIPVWRAGVTLGVAAVLAIPALLAMSRRFSSTNVMISGCPAGSAYYLAMTFTSGPVRRSGPGPGNLQGSRRPIHLTRPPRTGQFSQPRCTTACRMARRA